jgi:hypothetical protein
MSLPGFTAEASFYRSSTHYQVGAMLPILGQRGGILVHPAGCCPTGQFCCGDNVCCPNGTFCLFGNCVPGNGGGGGGGGGNECCPASRPICCGSCDSGTCDDVCIGSGQSCP